MRWSSLFSVASLLSLLSGAQELAPVLLNDPLVDVTRCTSAIDYQYYEVTGASRREVREQLLSKGPVDEHGYQRFAFAAWTLEWDWPLQADGTRRYSDTKVTCKAHVVLPRFRAPEHADPDFVSRTEEALKQIKEHELRHVSHAISGAHQLREGIVSAARSGKITREKHANRIAFRIVDHIKAFDSNYDAMTHYGETEGVWFK